MRVGRIPITALILTVTAGCGWEGSNNDDFSAWNESYNWANFSGVYRAPSGGLVVSGFEGTPGSAPTEVNYSQTFGTGVSGVHGYAGSLSRIPVVAGSVTFDCGSYHFSDNGSGVLVGSIAGTGGTVSYDTGSWSINLGALEFPVGVEIIANWRYTEGGSTGHAEPGNTGRSIYTFSVAQTGNALVFTDSNGGQYSGYISGLSTTGGNPGAQPVDTASGEIPQTYPQGQTATAQQQTTGSGEVVAQFEVQGQSSAGVHVRITGTLQSHYTATASAASTAGQQASVVISSRVMNGTWIEDNGMTGDIVGAASAAP